MKRLALFLALALPVFAAEQSRTWTDTKGRKMEGILKDKNDKEAVLVLKTGKRVTLKLADLSADDQKYVEAASVLPDPELTTKTVKIDSNEKGTKADARGVEITLKKMRDRKYTVIFQWLGPKGSTVGIYKSERRELSEDGSTIFKCTYKSENKDGVGADYKGYVVGIKDADGNWVAKDASQKPFERFLDEATK